jgi:DnaJ-class molecular chaperone
MTDDTLKLKAQNIAHFIRGYYRGSGLPATEDLFAVRDGAEKIIELVEQYAAKPPSPDTAAHFKHSPDLEQNQADGAATRKDAEGAAVSPICQECEGRGHNFGIASSDHRDYLACSDCAGSGMANLALLQRCPDCNGTGKKGV